MRATHDDRRRNMSQTGSSFNIAMAPDKIQPQNLTWIPKMMGWKMHFLSNTVWLFWSMLGRCNMNFTMITMLSRVSSDQFIKVSSLCKVVLQEAETAKCDLSDWLPSYPSIGGGTGYAALIWSHILGTFGLPRLFHCDSDGLYMPCRWFPLVQLNWQPNQICNHSVSTLPYLRWTCILWLIDISISFQLHFDGKIDLSQGP